MKQKYRYADPESSTVSLEHKEIVFDSIKMVDKVPPLQNSRRTKNIKMENSNS